MAPAHAPIDRFLQGINTAKLDLMLSAFAPNAEVVDDGQSFKGDAIRALCEHGIIGHSARVKVLEQKMMKDSRAYAHVNMEGDFGKEFGIHEPFDLFLIATVSNDRIEHLDMGGLNPEKPVMRAGYASVGSPNDPLSAVRINKRNVPDPREGYVQVKMVSPRRKHRVAIEICVSSVPFVGKSDR